MSFIVYGPCRFVKERPIQYNAFVKKAVFPGTFDPPTNGHANIIYRASHTVDELVVLISHNSQKKTLFSLEERRSFLEEIVRDLGNVRIDVWEGLIVDYAKKHAIKVIFRGVRALSDFAYEFELAMMNRGLDNNIETLLIPTAHEFSVLRSSAIKELASFGGDVSSMVSPMVESALKTKFAGKS